MADEIEEKRIFFLVTLRQNLIENLAFGDLKQAVIHHFDRRRKMEGKMVFLDQRKSKGVESRDRGAFDLGGFLGFAFERFPGPFFHFVGGLVRESEDQHLVQGASALFDKLVNPLGQNGGLAAAGSRRNEIAPFARGDGFFLSFTPAHRHPLLSLRRPHRNLPLPLRSCPLEDGGWPHPSGSRHPGTSNKRRHRTYS